MITEQDLRAAIAECQGERSPNANTCMKLAAYYTILTNLYPDNREVSYSYSEPPEYTSDTEFMKGIKGKDINRVMELVDELVSVIKVVHPRLYKGVISKLSEL